MTPARAKGTWCLGLALLLIAGPVAAQTAAVRRTPPELTSADDVAPGEVDSLPRRAVDAWPGFEFGVGGGPMRLSCVDQCSAASRGSIGIVLAFGGLVRQRLFVGVQAVSTALFTDSTPNLTVWAVMPVVRYYPSRHLYIGGGIGRGEAEGNLLDGDVKHGIWAFETRAGWTWARYPLLTPYVSYMRPLQNLRVERGTGYTVQRSEHLQIGLALSSPGPRP